MAEQTKYTCIHCGRPHNIRGRRGLCWPCSLIPEVREAAPRKQAKFVEPTEADLDAIIAEQLPSMPTRGDDDE